MSQIEGGEFRVKHLELLLSAERNRVAFQMGGHSYRIFITQYEDDVFGETVTYLLFDEKNALRARAASKLYHFEIDGERFEQLIPEQLSCEICTGGCPDCYKLRKES